MSPRQVKAAESRVEKAYYAKCRGIQIGIMDIPHVFAAGVEAIKAAPDLSDAELQDVVYAFVQTIRKN